MSWTENIKSQMIIVTGDGKEYKPLWLNASKSTEYNIATFDFHKVQGSRIDRSEPKGRKFPLQILFQGENHLEIAQNFEDSAKDKRAWTVTHPLYGRIVVHPSSLEFDNSKLNITEIKGTLFETITDDYPNTAAAPSDEIEYQSGITNEAYVLIGDSEIKSKGITQQSIKKLSLSLAVIDTSSKTSITDQDIAENYTNAYNDALTKINSIASEPTEAIVAMQTYLTMPANFGTSVSNRLNILSNNLTSLSSSIENALLIDKVMFEILSSAVIVAMCQSISLPLDGDFKNRNEVLETIDTLIASYNSYIENLDLIQTGTGSDPESYQPNDTSLFELQQLVNYTISNLFIIAIGARQQRSIILEKDSNWILIAHRLYGLKADDSTITEIIDNNNAGLNEMLIVKKNRKVVYFV